MKLLVTSLVFLLLSACGPKEPPPPTPEIGRIAMSTEKIEAGKPLPAFVQLFEEGVTAIYTYVWLGNVETMTDTFPVRASWFSPNDLNPPIARTTIELTPPQSIAQFSLHAEDGIQSGPYKIIIRAGENFTASGSMRFFVGMTEGEAEKFLQEEEKLLRAREEERRRRSEKE